MTLLVCSGLKITFGAEVGGGGRGDGEEDDDAVFERFAGGSEGGWGDGRVFEDMARWRWR